jgi:hypothetical protein
MAILKRAFTQDLSADPLDVEFEFIYNVNVLQVLIHTSVDVTEDLTITYIDVENGTNYSTLVRTRSLNEEQDAAELAIKLRLRQGDKIKIEMTNANETGIVYGTLQVEADSN